MCYESRSIELILKNSKITVLSTIYRPPDGDFKAFNTFSKDICSIYLNPNKLSYDTGDFSINVLDFNKNEKENFKDMTWGDVINSKQTDSAYKAFLNKFTSL